MSSVPSPARTAGPSHGAELPADAITAEGLPLSVRGYDRDRVERLLSRAANAYRQLVRQRDTLRSQLQAAMEQRAAAEGEAKVSARSVAELVQRCAALDSQLLEARQAREQLEERLRAAGRDGLRPARVPCEPASEALAVGMAEETLLPAGSQADAPRLLVAAVRASEEIRERARDQGRRAIAKARGQAGEIAAQTLRERALLDDARAARQRAEAEAERILLSAREEAARVSAGLAHEHQRVRELLEQVLASLDGLQKSRPDALVADLSARVREVDSQRYSPGAPTTLPVAEETPGLNRGAPE